MIKMAQTRSIFMIENYSDRGIPLVDPPLKFINCPKIEPWDFLLLVPELHLDLTTKKAIRDTTQKTGL